ncbi:MAG TPA: dockerin type I domain-containing protein [Phycisphaerae bacterium]|nr:dockerin type I domain-containing protein [Phycisphaerae bacterium]HRW55327.1 dockerin type I domain-containing protein [Phycisphaerae bacterium]
MTVVNLVGRCRRAPLIAAFATVFLPIAWGVGHTYGVTPNGAVAGRTYRCGTDVIPRIFHRAALLQDGRVMVTGGLGLTLSPAGLISLRDISIFNPASREFSTPQSVDGNAMRLITGRGSHTMTTLLDGRVLITGGNVGGSGRLTGRPDVTTELIDPDAPEIRTGPDMNEPRAYHTATRLSDGRVLVAGGRSWQLFDPEQNVFSAPVAMVRTRTRHAAVLLPAEHVSMSDRVLVIGGLGSGGGWLEILDPALMASRQLLATLPQSVNDLSAVRMANGRVLIVGGQLNSTLQTTTYVGVFDPVDESLRELPPIPDRGHGISDNELIAIGGYAVVFGGEQQVGREDTELDYIAIFNGESEQWEFVGAMLQPRDDFAAVRFDDDRVLLIDGAYSKFGVEAPTATSEMFELTRVVLGDMNNDGAVTTSDVGPFVRVVLAPDEADAIRYRAADLNSDLYVDRRDIALFQDRLSGAADDP